MWKALIAAVILSLVNVPGFVEWEGRDPYPSVDWSGAKPELRPLVEKFEEEWGTPLTVRQVYRPAEYGKHLRSSWELWRWMNGKSYTSGYGCDGYEHIKPEEIRSLTYFQKKLIGIEAKRHAFPGGHTPPACRSDHALGIAVDIAPPKDYDIYKKWVKAGASVGLCHYIAGDMPHWGIAEYLPDSTDCRAL